MNRWVEFKLAWEPSVAEVLMVTPAVYPRDQQNVQ